MAGMRPLGFGGVVVIALLSGLGNATASSAASAIQLTLVDQVSHEGNLLEHDGNQDLGQLPEYGAKPASLEAFSGGSQDFFLRSFQAMTRWFLSTYGLSDAEANVNATVWPAFTFSWRVILATVFAILAAALATAGGVGGGPLFVPIVNLLLGYDAKTSAALSKSMVFGGTIASVLFNIQLKHPRLEKALIDFDIAVLMQPLLLLGISIGVTTNVVLPAWLVEILLCVLLFFMTYKTLTKGVSTWKQEEKKAKAKKATALGSDSAPASAQGASSDLKKPLLQTASEILSKVQFAPSNQGPILPLIKWRNLAEMGSVWVVYVIIQVVKASVPTCGVLYWVLNAAQIPISVSVSYVGARRLLAEHETRLAGAHELGAYSAEETQWGVGLLVAAPLYALATGFIGGLFGIGGAVVMGPVLLELGLLPQVTAATSSFMILFSSSMSVIEYYLLGRLPPNVALYLFSICLIAALFGLSIVRAVVVWSGKASVIIFVLGGVIGLSALVILFLGGLAIYFDWVGGAYMGFSALCTA